MSFLIKQTWGVSVSITQAIKQFLTTDSTLSIMRQEDAAEKQGKLGLGARVKFAGMGAVASAKDSVCLLTSSICELATSLLGKGMRGVTLGYCGQSLKDYTLTNAFSQLMRSVSFAVNSASTLTLGLVSSKKHMELQLALGLQRPKNMKHHNRAYLTRQLMKSGELSKTNATK